MDFFIRPVRPEDADDINIMRRQPEVARWMMSLPSERVESSQNFIGNLRPNNHEFVAVMTLSGGQERVIGIAGLEVGARPRIAHTATMGICVHRDYQDKGVGSKLMEALLDLADNWLRLVRVELQVYAGNERAIHLYEKYGFEKEGLLRKASIQDGEYVDEYVMSRIRHV